MNFELIYLEPEVAEAMIGYHVRTEYGYEGVIVSAKRHNFTMKMKVDGTKVKQLWNQIVAVREWGME